MTQPQKSYKLLYNTRRKFYKYIDNIAFRKNFKVADAVLVFGAPRTGTTWFIDILNTIPDFLSIFEPLNPIWFKAAQEINITSRPYRNPEETDLVLEELFRDLLRGKIRSENPHIKMTFYDIFKRVTSKRLLLKFTRGNRLLPWVSNNFKVDKTYLIVRHPCATISSQMQEGLLGYGRGVFPEKNTVLNEIKQIDYLDDELISELNKITSLEEILAVVYALDYVVPFKHGISQWKLVCYEELLVNGDRVIKQIFSELNARKYYEYASKRSKAPSLTTNKTEYKHLEDINSQLNKWKTRLDGSQKAIIRDVLNCFDIDFDESSYRIIDNKFPNLHQSNLVG